MKENILKHITAIIFAGSVIYLGVEFYKTQNTSNELEYALEFESKILNLNNIRTDSIYRLTTIVKNNSDRLISYKLKSTCGCTIVGDINKQIKALSTDEIDISLSSYNKKSNFNSMVFMLDDNNIVRDTLFINAGFYE